MTPEQTKAAWQSLGITMPIVALACFFLQQKYGVQLPVDVQGYVVNLMDVAIPALMMLAAWGRARAKAVIDRWF